MILLKELDKNNKTFEDIKHIDENGIEFRLARELMNVLQYSALCQELGWIGYKKLIHSFLYHFLECKPTNDKFYYF